jgi:hypothetical protein
MLNNNFIGVLIAILVSILFAFKLDGNKNDKKEPYAGGMPSRRLVSQKIAAFVPNKDCNDPNKVQFYSVSNFNSNPSQRGTNPEVGPLLRTQLSNPSRLSNDFRLKVNSCKTSKVENFEMDQEEFDNNYRASSSCKTAEVEDFVGMVEEGFDSNCRASSSYASLPVVEPNFASGNYNDMKNKDVILSDMMPVGDMRAAVDDEGNPGNIYQFERFMYSNLKDNRNVKDSDFIRGDLAIPPNKGTCWFGQRGYSLRPSALGMLGGDDLANTKSLDKIQNPYTGKSLSSNLGAASGDIIVDNKTASFM